MIVCGSHRHICIQLGAPRERLLREAKISPSVSGSWPGSSVMIQLL